VSEIRARDELEEVAGGVQKIDPAAAVLVVDLSRFRPLRIRPMLRSCDLRVSAVEVGVVDEIGIVLRR